MVEKVYKRKECPQAENIPILKGSPKIPGLSIGIGTDRKACFICGKLLTGTVFFLHLDDLEKIKKEIAEPIPDSKEFLKIFGLSIEIMIDKKARFICGDFFSSVTFFLDDDIINRIENELGKEYLNLA